MSDEQLLFYGYDNLSSKIGCAFHWINLFLWVVGCFGYNELFCKE